MNTYYLVQIRGYMLKEREKQKLDLIRTADFYEAMKWYRRIKLNDIEDMTWERSQIITVAFITIEERSHGEILRQEITRRTVPFYDTFPNIEMFDICLN